MTSIDTLKKYYKVVYSLLKEYHTLKFEYIDSVYFCKSNKVSHNIFEALDKVGFIEKRIIKNKIFIRSNFNYKNLQPIHIKDLIITLNYITNYGRNCFTRYY